VKVLMIGGTGLISSSIVPLLLARGDDVAILSRGVSDRPLPAGCAHIAGDRTASGFEQLIGEAPRFDCVIDMVCYRPEDAASSIRAFAGRTAQYIFTSTIDVYRKPASRYPYREDEPFGGIGDYATDKVACELLFRDAYERDGFPVTVIRPAATYGDRHLPVHSLGRSTTYLDRLMRGKPIVVHGDGSSLWVSCHADDVAGAFAGAAGNEGAIGRSYHAAGEEWVTWNEHHAILAEAIGAPPPTLVHIPTDALVELAGERAELVRDNFQYHDIFDNSAARDDLGFRYTIPLRVGLPGWYASLVEAGMIENSDGDPFDDRLIDTWARVIARGAAELGGAR
jgi:nucleoside-diphosphate-sugar epimerase